MYLFLDVETAGLPDDHDAPASHLGNWPRLVQIAWILTEVSGNALRSQAFIIRPEGFEIPPGAVRVHGITTATAKKCGVDVQRALSAFAEDLGTCGVLVAHNVQFDERVVGAEFLRAGWPNPIESKARLCTMRSSAEFCGIPGRRGYKWPTLEELHRALFGAPLASAHDAVADVRSCAKCFFELKRRGILAVPGPPSCPSVKHPSTT